MLGDNLLVGAFSKDVHLPEGEWIDYWSGRRYTGPLDLYADIPSDRGGPLFIKAGAILPTWPEMDYVGHRPVDEIGLHVYPGTGSEFKLYEDDGSSYQYLEGEVATTVISCRKADSGVVVRLGGRQGVYEGMPVTRTFDVRIYSDQAPSKLILNGKEFSGEEGWLFEDGHTRVRAYEDPEGNPVEIRLIYPKH